MLWCVSTPFRLDVEAPRHGRIPDGGGLTLTARLLEISQKIGAFSSSRSNLELDSPKMIQRHWTLALYFSLTPYSLESLKSPPFDT